jgi:enoyl-CoA hydratase/carnithine racemase
MPDVEGETLQLEVHDRVATITLDRPERRNAFTGRMGAELSDAYRACDEDDDVRAVVLTGAPPAFCAGADLSSQDETFARTGPGFSAGGVDFPAWRVRKPVIAAVNGHAVGIGLTLALQCDFRVMAAEATYGVVQPTLGVMGDAWSHWTLPRLVGVARAAEILLLGERFDGEQAGRLGIATRVTAADDVLPTALALAEQVVRTTAPLSVAASKRLLWSSFERSASEIGQAETALHVRLMAHPDAREGVRAALDRRDPEWTGRAGDLDY